MNLLSKLTNSYRNRNKVNLNKESGEEIEAIDNNTADDSIIHLIAVGLVFILLIIFYYYTSKILSVIIGTLYPVYGSIVALDNEHADRTKWLKYWISYAFICFLDPFFSFFIGGFSIYGYIKILMFIWLMLPNQILNGLDLFYELVALPLYLEVTNYLKRENILIQNSEDNGVIDTTQ